MKLMFSQEWLDTASREDQGELIASGPFSQPTEDAEYVALLMKIKKLYLGDSVYMCWHGGVLILTTENGLPTDPSNTIILEPEVLNTLIIAIEAKRKVT